MGKIIICRADEALEIAKTQNIAAMLSIEHPDAEEGNGRAPRLAEHGLTIAHKIQVFWDTEDPAAVNAPSPAHVMEGMRFIAEHLEKGDVVVHCHAGIARSTGMALGAMALRAPHRPEMELVEELLKIRDIALPNMLVVQHADGLLKRGGRLARAALTQPTIAFRRTSLDAARQRWMQKNPDVVRKMYPEKFPKP